MTKDILMAASALALIASVPAFAQTANSEPTAGQRIERSVDKAGKEIKQTAEKAGDAVKGAYADMKAYFTNESDVKSVTSVNVLDKLTADEIIGRTVKNGRGETIGSIEDILIDKDGDAEAVIIKDGGLLGLGGKSAAFDYDVIEGMSADKDIVARLGEDVIKKAVEYNPDKMAPDRYSVRKILDADVVDPRGKKVADVDTVAFDDGDADYVIVTFDKVLGMGGETAALNLDALNLQNNKGKYRFTLSEQQSAQFENYKDSVQSN